MFKRGAMTFSRSDADVFAPDGTPPEQALARTTHLCVGAHQDDIEIMAQAGIAACFGSTEHFFTGVVATDGAGAPRAGPAAARDDATMRAVRRAEQRRAAVLGRYGLQLQLGHPSDAVRATAPEALRGDLAAIFGGCAALDTVYLHNPADKHDTHVAVLLRSLEALRSLPPARRPRQLLGCEVWRDLDWLADGDKVALDAGGDPALAAELLRAFQSQIAGGKRYDLAALGRRAANATFHAPREADRFSAVTWAMDLTPLLADDTLSVNALVQGHVDRLAADIADRLRRMGATS